MPLFPILPILHNLPILPIFPILHIYHSTSKNSLVLVNPVDSIIFVVTFFWCKAGMFLASLSSLAYLTYLIYPTYPTYPTYHIYLTYLTCLTILTILITLPNLHLSNILVTSRNSPVLDNPVDPVISVSFIWSKA